MKKRSLKQRQNETLKIGIILGILFFLFALFISGSHLVHQRAVDRLREELNKQPYKVPLEPGNDRLIEWNDIADTTAIGVMKNMVKLSLVEISFRIYHRVLIAL